MVTDENGTKTLAQNLKAFGGNIFAARKFSVRKRTCNSTAAETRESRGDCNWVGCEVMAETLDVTCKGTADDPSLIEAALVITIQFLERDARPRVVPRRVMGEGDLQAIISI